VLAAIIYTLLVIGSWASSVSIVSDYRLDDRGSIPAEAKHFSSSLCVQTSSETHLASSPKGIVSFPGGKARPGRDADQSHHHIVLRSRMSRSYTPLSLVTCMAVAGQLGCLLMFLDFNPSKPKLV
jgi:hypothetical protein